MEFFDVVFPVNLSPLTYGCVESISGTLKPGMIVGAPLKNRITKGVVIGKAVKIPAGKVKNIQEIHSDTPVLSSQMIVLLKWMSEYYFAAMGLVLKTMLPQEAFSKVKQRSVKGEMLCSRLPVVTIDSALSESFIKSLNKNIYKTYLFYAPSSLHEYSFLIRALSETGNAIVLAPEISIINNLYPAIKERFGERVCLFHSDLSRSRRSDAIDRILSGSSDIVLGTMSAVFAPLKKVSLIAVLQEHSSSYKQEKMPCYNGRDVAVMRGYIEKAVVLLSSVCPSIESFHNCRSGKYFLLKQPAVDKRPKIRIMDLRYEKLLKPYLSERIITASSKYMKHGRKIIFSMNRRGHSSLLRCSDCNYVEECPVCRIPLVFHKKDISMKCHYCGYVMSKVPERCGRCKSYHIEMLGAGTQRVQEDIESLLGIRTLRIDRDAASKKSQLNGLIEAASGKDGRILIGTKLATKRLRMVGVLSMAAVLNADLSLHIPDFRSAERVYQEISSITDNIEPDGEIFIQTRMPQNYLYKHLKNHDYASFVKEELQRRKVLNYPPFSRLLLLKFISEKDIAEKLSEISRRIGPGIEILGPHISKNRSGSNEFRLLLRSSIRGMLHSTARTFTEEFKSAKDVRVKIDVDPIMI